MPCLLWPSLVRHLLISVPPCPALLYTGCAGLSDTHLGVAESGCCPDTLPRCEALRNVFPKRLVFMLHALMLSCPVAIFHSCHALVRLCDAFQRPNARCNKTCLALQTYTVYFPLADNTNKLNLATGADVTSSDYMSTPSDCTYSQGNRR